MTRYLERMMVVGLEAGNRLRRYQEKVHKDAKKAIKIIREFEKERVDEQSVSS